jgi:hypothetical protein
MICQYSIQRQVIQGKEMKGNKAKEKRLGSFYSTTRRKQGVDNTISTEEGGKEKFGG